MSWKSQTQDGYPQYEQNSMDSLLHYLSSAKKNELNEDLISIFNRISSFLSECACHIGSTLERGVNFVKDF
jgi:hypothetical protein